MEFLKYSHQKTQRKLTHILTLKWMPHPLHFIKLKPDGFVKKISRLNGTEVSSETI